MASSRIPKLLAQLASQRLAESSSASSALGLLLQQTQQPDPVAFGAREPDIPEALVGYRLTGQEQAKVLAGLVAVGHRPGRLCDALWGIGKAEPEKAASCVAELVAKVRRPWFADEVFQALIALDNFRMSGKSDLLQMPELRNLIQSALQEKWAEGRGPNDLSDFLLQSYREQSIEIANRLRQSFPGAWQEPADE